MDFNANGTWQVSALGRFNAASEVRQVYQMHLLGVGTLTEEQGFDDLIEWVTAVLTILKAIQTTLLVWRGISINTLDGLESSGEIAFDTPLTGEDVGDPLPPGVALLQYMNTGRSRVQLRKYIPGLTENAVGAFGGFSSSYTLEALDVAPLMLETFSATNGDWQYGHRTTSGTPEFLQPTALSMSLVPAYQRRRKQGRGI